MSVQRNIELIKEILANADAEKKHGNTHELAIYQLGYLIGLLARLANEDNLVYYELKRILEKQLTQKRSKI